MSMETPPWYRTTRRWGQTNLTEIDPVRYDAAWWREQWRRTHVQGIIVNAGGIVAYYPSALPLHHRAEHLGNRDLFGEIADLAREDGIVVVARMDSNRADHRMFVEHPEWFTRDADGRPYRAGDLYITCVNSPWYDTFIPAVLEEVIDRYRPAGFADNSWSGLQRSRICHCENCARSFRDAFGAALPHRHDVSDAVYRDWIRWNYDRRLAIWDRNNEITSAAGGEHCLWVGMNAGEISAQSAHFRDYRAIAQRSEIIFLDSQFRHAGQGFQRNGEMGAALHGMMGWDKLIPESMAMYGAGTPAFRLASKPVPDARLWALDGFSGGIQPWWHHIGAYHDDRRQYTTAPSIFAWHRAHEDRLTNLTPAATVGIVWSQENVDFYGGDQVAERYTLPWTGFADALVRHRIPYVPVHAADIPADPSRIATLVLPNVGALSDEQFAALDRYVAAGGGVVATGETGLYDLAGQRRAGDDRAALFGVTATWTHHGHHADDRPSWDTWDLHSYLRFSPERRRWIDGPQMGNEPDDDTPRHAVLAGLDTTDTVPFGGRLEVVTVADDTMVPITFVPPFPIYPPETSWMRDPSSSVPALVLREHGSGRVAYLAADLDRAFARNRQPDHATLLANTVRWAANESIPVLVQGPGFVHIQIYRQGDATILFLVNLTGYETGNVPAYEHVPVGPLTVTLRGLAASHVEALVGDDARDLRATGDGVSFVVPSLVDHEVLVLR